jgi:hypothetical protein
MMTKRVRIENADGGQDVDLIVELIEIDPHTREETLISSTMLHNPADLAEFYIWQNRYLKVREVIE